MDLAATMMGTQQEDWLFHALHRSVAIGQKWQVVGFGTILGQTVMPQAAMAWIDRLHEAGQSWWQALPLGPTGYGNSPYQSLSSFAGNELLISPDGLIEDGLLRASACKGKSFSAVAIDYDVVIPFKRRILEAAWGNFRAGARGDLRPAYEQFCNIHRPWLEDYALFRALKARYDGASYLEWPDDIVRRMPAALDRARRDLATQVDRIRFAQFLLFSRRVKDSS